MIYKNQAKSIPFNIGVDGLTWTIHVSLDGASYVAASGSTVAAKTGAAGGYVLNAAAADLNADVSEFLLTSSGDTPYVLTITVTTDNEADIRTAVWGSSTVKEVTSLNSNAMSNVARAVWDALTPDHNSIGTMGAFANFLDDIYNKTNQLNFSGTDIKATLDGEKVGLSAGQVVASVTEPVTTTSDTDIDTILANTNRIPTSPAAVGSAMTLADNAITEAKIAADAVTEIQSGLATASAVSAVKVDTEAAITNISSVQTTASGIKTKTDKLGFTETNRVLASSDSQSSGSGATAGQARSILALLSQILKRIR